MLKKTIYNILYIQLHKLNVIVKSLRVTQNLKSQIVNYHNNWKNL